MAAPASPVERLRIRCPHCAKTFRVKPDLVGKTGPCAACGQPFTIAPACIVTEEAKPAAPAPPVPSGPPGAPPPEPAGTVFASAEHGYSFVLAGPGWQRLNRRDEKQFEADVFVTHEQIGAIKCVVYPCEVSFEELDSRLEEAYATEVRKFKCHRHERGTVAGLPCALVDYQGIAEGEQKSARYLACVFVKDGKSLQVIGMTDPQRFPQIRKVVRDAVATLSFDPAQARRATDQTLPPTQPTTLQRLLLPRAVFVFVPAAFVVGFLVWRQVSADVAHFGAGSKWVTYLWWLIYPAIGYYVAMGWEGSGYPAARALRDWATRMAVLASDAMAGMFTMVFGMVGGGGARAMGQLMREWGRLCIRAGSFLFGRLGSAWVVALPQTVWQAATGGRPVGVPGSIALHAAGAVPGLLVAALFFTPFAAQSDVHMQQMAAEAEARRAAALAARTAKPRAGATDPAAAGAGDRASTATPAGAQRPMTGAAGPAAAAGPGREAQTGVAGPRAGDPPVAAQPAGPGRHGVAPGQRPIEPPPAGRAQAAGEAPQPEAADGRPTGPRAAAAGADRRRGTGDTPAGADDVAGTPPAEPPQPDPVVVCTTADALAQALQSANAPLVIWARIANEDCRPLSDELKAWVSAGGVLVTDTDLAKRFALPLDEGGTNVPQGPADICTDAARGPHPIVAGLEGQKVYCTLGPGNWVLKPTRSSKYRSLLYWPAASNPRRPTRGRAAPPATELVVCAVLEYGRGWVVYRPAEIDTRRGAGREFEARLTEFCVSSARAARRGGEMQADPAEARPR